MAAITKDPDMGITAFCNSDVKERQVKENFYYRIPLEIFNTEVKVIYGPSPRDMFLLSDFNEKEKAAINSKSLARGLTCTTRFGQIIVWLNNQLESREILMKAICHEVNHITKQIYALTGISGYDEELDSCISGYITAKIFDYVFDWEEEEED